MPPRAKGRQPAFLTAEKELVIPTAAIATVVPKWARNDSVGPHSSGMTPTLRTVAATRNHRRKGGTRRHHTVSVRSAAGRCRLPNHCWNKASGTIMRVRVNLTTTA